MKRNNFLILLVTLFTLTDSAAQVMTLPEILSKVERENPMLAMYRSKADALDAYAEGATAWMAPMAGFGTFMTPYPTGKMENNGESAENPGSLMISVEQTIPNKKRTQANRSYLSEKSKSEEFRRAQQWNELRFETRQAYYTWSVALEKLKKLDEIEEIIKLLEASAVVRLGFNQGTPSTVYRAQARLAEIRNMRTMTEGVVEESKTMLATLMNLPSGFNFSIKPAILNNEMIISSDTATLASVRSDIRGIDQEIALMKLNQQLQSMQSKPELKLRFDHMQTYGNMPDQFTAMAMFTIPVAPWSAKMYKSEIEGMNREIQSMKEERAARLLETRGMINRMTVQLRTMKSQLDRYEQEILPALQRNYESLRISWEENREQLPMVLDGLEALSMAEQEYLEKKESLYLMIASYEKLIEQ